jgi:hypothetical protein
MRIEDLAEEDPSGHEAQRAPTHAAVFMADPPPSAISNWNPPRKTGTYMQMSTCKKD